MISVQAECSVDVAWRLLQDRAAALIQDLEPTALDVLDGIIRFDG